MGRAHISLDRIFLICASSYLREFIRPATHNCSQRKDTEQARRDVLHSLPHKASDSDHQGYGSGKERTQQTLFPRSSVELSSQEREGQKEYEKVFHGSTSYPFISLADIFRSSLLLAF